MEKVLIDLTNTQLYYHNKVNFHGGGEYGVRLLKELIKNSEKTEMGIFFNIGYKMDMQLIEDCKKANINIHPCRGIESILTLIRKYNYTTIYSNLPIESNWRNIRLPENVRFIFTIHGLRGIETAAGDSFKVLYENDEIAVSDVNYGEMINDDRNQEKVELCKMQYRSLFNITDNRIIITDSVHSKYSILFHFPEINRDEIRMLYAPLKETEKINNEIEEMKTLTHMDLRSGEYGLMVSAGIWRKNCLRGALAYDMLYDENFDFIPKNFKTVILGVKNKNTYLNRLKHKERFILCDYVEDEMLEIFYKHAQLFLYPSLNEGFGYPPLEAMKYGTLCACSVSCSISEICRDMVWYFNPYSIEEICNRLLQSFDKELRIEKKERIEKVLPLIYNRQEEELEKQVRIILGESD